MSRYENIAEGVITYIPDPELLKALKAPSYGPMMGYNVLNYLNRNNISREYWESNYLWLNFHEFYNDRYKNWFYQFKSWEELKFIISQPREVVDSRSIAKKMIESSFTDRKIQLEKWKLLFESLLTSSIAS